jgi:hypothetical protein
MFRKLPNFALLILAAALSLAAQSAPARAQDFALERGTVRLDVPAHWQEVRDLFGMPLMFLGPESHGGRPVLSITPTGRSRLSFDSAALKKNEDEYRQGREAWLDRHDGQAISWSGYRTEKWTGGLEAHAIGYQYRLGGVEFTERSYFVNCHDRLYHLKSLTRGGQDFSVDLKRMLGSFACD